jgi:hypothetical protein
VHVVRTGLLVLASFTAACGASPTGPQPPAPPDGRLTGNVDVRPFTALEAYAYRRDAGELWLRVATPNEVGGVHGSLEGRLPFSLCP